ncbi:hypothetical protein SANT12839_084040 [Streptomyces antimycoticus]|uniref:Uncharacterized protein n=1 Tax=Streptomyces antimycoticus TaxID=68175 RepID=A0A4D4KGJ7_9ACTN|nr:hypothetical protein SANT12839_084040 [Streptomyces antimycoticus]
MLEVLDLDVVRLARGELDGLGGLLLVPVVHPVVDDRLAVDPQPEAVVAGDREGVRTGALRCDLAGPADADVVGPSGGGLQPRIQIVEVQGGVEAGGLQLMEVEGPRADWR